MTGILFPPSIKSKVTFFPFFSIVKLKYNPKSFSTFPSYVFKVTKLLYNSGSYVFKSIKEFSISRQLFKNIGEKLGNILISSAMALPTMNPRNS